jgi:hypothetical protein
LLGSWLDIDNPSDVKNIQASEASRQKEAPIIVVNFVSFLREGVVNFFMTVKFKLIYVNNLIISCFIMYYSGVLYGLVILGISCANSRILMVFRGISGEIID